MSGGSTIGGGLIASQHETLHIGTLDVALEMADITWKKVIDELASREITPRSVSYSNPFGRLSGDMSLKHQDLILSEPCGLDGLYDLTAHVRKHGVLSSKHPGQKYGFSGTIILDSGEQAIVGVQAKAALNPQILWSSYVLKNPRGVQTYVSHRPPRTPEAESVLLRALI